MVRRPGEAAVIRIHMLISLGGGSIGEQLSVFRMLRKTHAVFIGEIIIKL